MRLSGYDSSSMSTLLSSLNGGRSNNSLYNINLGDYSMIKTGSYGKLLKSYYSQGLDETGVGKASESKKSSATSKDSAKTLAGIEAASDDLVASAQALYKSTGASPFKEKNGQMDTDKIYSAVKNFVEDYNSLISAADKSETSNIKSATASMVRSTSMNQSALKSIGISIDEKTDMLKVDEEKFKGADMSKVKSLFNGNGSFAYATAVKAAGIKSYADYETKKSATYGSAGTYTYNNMTGDIFSSQF